MAPGFGRRGNPLVAEVVGSTPTVGSALLRGFANNMTRLDDTRRKKYYSQLGLYLLLFVLILFFFGTIGIKLLINTSLFISGLQHKTPETQNFDLMAPPEIVDIPSATNSATITISGNVAPKKSLTVYVNNNSQKELITDDNGFTTDITLQEGENSVYVEVSDENGSRAKKSKVYTVVYKNKQLKLDISAPTEGDKTNKDEITVSGSTDTDTAVKINGSPVVVNSTGSFSDTVQLQEGENKIIVEAQDTAGNNERKELTIAYEKD